MYFSDTCEYLPAIIIGKIDGFQYLLAIIIGNIYVFQYLPAKIICKNVNYPCFYNELYSCIHPVAGSLFGPLWHREESMAEPSRAKPSQAGPGRAEPSRDEPSRAEPSQADPSRSGPDRAKPSRVEPNPSLYPNFFPTVALTQTGKPVYRTPPYIHER